MVNIECIAINETGQKISFRWLHTIYILVVHQVEMGSREEQNVRRKEELRMGFKPYID